MIITTTANRYTFDTTTPEGKAGYKALRAKLSGLGLQCFESHGGKELHATVGRKLQGHTLTLETKHVFSNQWNTAPVEGVSEKGLRVFDWAQDYRPGGSSTLKQGYWLTQTDEMSAVRRDTAACGYCGKQEPVSTCETFCTKCAGSTYLNEETLGLTRMQTVGNTAERGPLTDEERAWLLPRMVAAQLHTRNEAAAKARVAAITAVKEKARATITNAEHEKTGMLWLLERGFNTDNVIYYTHTGRFCFGWRAAVGPELEASLLDALSEFGHAYEIKCTDGRILSGY